MELLSAEEKVMLGIEEHDPDAEKTKRIAQELGCAAWMLKRPNLTPLPHTGVHNHGANLTVGHFNTYMVSGGDHTARSTMSTSRSTHSHHHQHTNLRHRASLRWLRKSQLAVHPAPVGSVYLPVHLQAQVITAFNSSFNSDDLIGCLFYCNNLKQHTDFKVLSHALRLAKKKLLFVDNRGITAIAAFVLPNNSVLESVFRLPFARAVSTLRECVRECQKCVSLARFRQQRLSDAMVSVNNVRPLPSQLLEPWKHEDVLGFYELLFMESVDQLDESFASLSRARTATWTSRANMSISWQDDSLLAIRDRDSADDTSSDEST